LGTEKGWIVSSNGHKFEQKSELWQFVTECEAALMRISTFISEAMLQSKIGELHSLGRE